MKKVGLLALLGTFITIAPSFAQTIWIDGAGDQMWSSGGNWNTGLKPTSSSHVQIGTQPTGDQIGIDTSAATTVASFTFNNTLTGPVDIAPVLSETLKVNGAIVNNSAFTDSFSIPVIAGASAIWTGPLNLTSSLDLGKNTITVVGQIAVSGLTLTVNGASDYGKFAGAGSIQLDNTISFNFAAATGAGSWDIASMTPVGTLTSVAVGGSYAGALTQITPGNWAATFNGMDWTYKASTGVLTAVPEPSTVGLLVGSLATVFAWRRLRKDD